MRTDRIMICYFIIYFLCSFWIGLYRGVEGAPCNAGDTLGEPNRAPTNATASTTSGTSYLLLGTRMIIPCCGVITQWNFGAINTGDLTAQVWEQVAGNTYKVVGENIATGVSANNELQMVIGDSEQISVQAGNVIGWYSSAATIPAYNTDGGANMGVSTNAGKTNVDGTVAWSTALVNTEQWLVEVEFGPGSPPDFGTSLPQTVTAAVSDAVGTKLHDLTPTDSNTIDIDTLTVSITSGGTDFELVGNEVKTKTTLTPGNHEVVFEVVDSCLLTGTATLTVTVTDDAPVITSLNAAVEVREDSAVEEELHVLVFTDIDTPLEDVNCRVNSTDPTPAPFVVKMSGTSSAVYYVPTPGAPLVYDTASLYSVYIVCNDGTSDSVAKLLQVTIIPNEPPVPTIPAPLEVDAEVTDASDKVGEVTATDPENDRLTYTMSNCSCPFIMSTSGEIFATENLNSHRTPFYTVNVTVYDGYNVVGPTEMNINILNINTPPTIDYPNEVLPSIDAVSVDEHTDEATPNAIGDTVTVFTAAGSDVEGDTLTWEMNFKNGKGQDLYELDPVTGIVTTKQDLHYEELLREDLVDTFVEIRAFDGREYSEWRTVKITVNDINETPVFDSDLYHIETDESAASLDCPFFDVTDEDKYDTETYTLDCGGVGIFQVSADNNYCGALLEQTAEYDLDTLGIDKRVITCAVTVTDKGGLTATSTLQITVNEENDNVPVFNPTTYAYTITNSSAVGGVFGQVTATDDDVLDKHNRITYSTTNNNFGVDADGNIYSKTDWSQQYVPRTETFMVTATDRDKRDNGDLEYRDTAEVTVNIVPAPTTTTTTTVATTLAESYQEINSFLDDPGNLAWLIPAILLGLAALGLSIFMCIRCCTPGACANMCKGGSLFRRTGRGRIGGRTVKRVREPVRTVRRTLVREKREPIRVVEREAPREFVKETPPKEPKKDSNLFDCFKSKPKDKPPPAAESWDFWNSGGF